MGPLSHALASKIAGLPVAGGLWPDLPVVIRSRRVAELTHGLPGAVVAAAAGGVPWLLAWALHVALDTISHQPGEGATGKRRWLWLP